LSRNVTTGKGESVASAQLGVSVGAWNALVRRAQIGRERKAACLVVSSYANADGTHIHCGVARIAVDLEVSYSTARRYMAWLRTVGLIELVRAGSRRRGLSAEYRLIIGPDVTEHVEVLGPDRHEALAEGIREAEREGSRARGKRFRDKNQRSSTVGVVIPLGGAGPGADQRSPGGALKTATNAQIAPDQRSPMGELPPSLSTSPYRSTSPKTTDDGDLRMNLALVGDDPEPEPDPVVVEIFPGASHEPPFVTAPPGPTLSRAQQTIAEATARTEARKAAYRARRGAQ
jgi:hypothetical protein